MKRFLCDNGKQIVSAYIALVIMTCSFNWKLSLVLGAVATVVIAGEFIVNHKDNWSHSKWGSIHNSQCIIPCVCSNVLCRAVKAAKEK